jgi:hypothetical protein
VACKKKKSTQRRLEKFGKFGKERKNGKVMMDEGSQDDKHTPS